MNQNWILGIIAAILLASGGMLIRHETKISLWDKVISEPVEKALGELRDKTNKQSEACTGAAHTVDDVITTLQTIGLVKQS